MEPILGPDTGEYLVSIHQICRPSLVALDYNLISFVSSSCEVWRAECILICL